MSAYDVAVLADAPTSFYKTDETSGTSFADSGSGAHGATLTGAAATLAVDIFAEKGVEFTADGTYLSAAIGSLAVAGSWECIVHVYSDTTNFNVGYAATQTDSGPARNLGQLFGTMNCGSEGTGPGSLPALSVGDHHLVFTQAAGGAQKAYLDGVAVDDGTASYVPGTASGGSLFAPLDVFNSGVPHVAIGKIAYYDNVVLTSSQVAAHYAALSGGAGGGVVATRRSWDGGFTVEFDTSGGEFDPDVVPLPAADAPAGAVITAVVVDAVTDVNGRTVPTVRTLSKPRDRYRVVLGGKDVTVDANGVRTPQPTYSLVSPLLYGSGSLTLPGVHAALQSAGVDKFATCKVQRIDSAGNRTTDYIGFVSDDPPNGRDWTSTLGGEATGRAAMQDRPIVVFPNITDIGSQVTLAIKNRLRLPVAAAPVTGIELAQSGGTTELDHISEILAKSTARDGTQWTVMPNADGRYEMAPKDLVTIAATVYIDGFRVVENLKRDYAEEPNRVWAQGFDDDGRRIWNADFPGLAGPDEIAFPGSTLHPGDTGDAVTALIERLWVTDFIDGVDIPSAWTTATDDPVTDAIEDLQDTVGLSVTGNVNEATWNALFDPDKSGYSLRGARIRPMAQRSYTEPFLYTASGQKRGRNPNFVRSKLLVDATADLGRVKGTKQARHWAKRELAPEGVSNWVGTITVTTGAVIDGEHNPGDPLTTDLVRDARSIRPGMNLWVPNWDGGTLVHVSGVTVQAGSVEFAVDTQARDTMKVWEIIARNRDSRRTPHRQWIAQNRRSGQQPNDGAFYDGKWFGKIARTHCPAGTWTVVPTPAGRSGTLQGLHFSTDNPVEMAVQVWDRERTTEWLDAHVGDWNTTDFWNHFNDNINEWKKDRGLIDHWGSVDQPAGYGYAAKNGPGGVATGAVLTGDFDFSAGAPYYCHAQPVLWVAFRPLEDCHVKGGRVLQLLLDDAAG